MSLRVAAVGCSLVLGACTSGAIAPNEDLAHAVVDLRAETDDLSPITVDAFSGSWLFQSSNGSASCQVTTALDTALASNLVIERSADDLTLTFVSGDMSTGTEIFAHRVDTYDATITGGTHMGGTVIANGGMATANQTSLHLGFQYAQVLASGTCSGSESAIFTRN